MTTELTAPDGTRLVVEVTGAGPSAVFVHGTGGSLDTWADVGSRLPGHRVAYYARRNHAPSDAGLSPNSFATEAADLQAVLGLLADRDGQRVHVIGGSYGATVALHAAADNSERIASLALFEPPLLQAGKHLMPVLDQFRRLCAAEQFDSALELFAHEAARIPPAVLAEAQQSAEYSGTSRAATVAVQADLESMATDTDDTMRWASINVPVLLMQGGQSWSPLPDAMDRLAAALPHAQRVCWPDQSHFAIATAPARVAEAIQNFIAAVSP
ncbi:alpha/beta hydrolase [Mycolicibacterium pulveris]|uniref:AB hydrolase-1 domain-containing protein n=1 Tax=Mycolicibacterium pulveris TaxID=36813 RepID=A0A7I7UPS3_MYCPV|nr:alpha/beta hydrolase [Mycolicibacterium pulveris]MCV6983582.1 alpha/beta hydrolase [Mycolicibacterium pulveris]BBY83462.1 hypothetical protein MPUL_46200 [Mycolicibacterium pulveris]